MGESQQGMFSLSRIFQLEFRLSAFLAWVHTCASVALMNSLIRKVQLQLLEVADASGLAVVTSL